MAENPHMIRSKSAINKAKTLLRERNNTVTEVAELVGFADHKYFREVFKKATGITPSEYAKGKNEHSQAQP